MANDLLVAGVAAWLIAAMLALTGRGSAVARALPRPRRRGRDRACRSQLPAELCRRFRRRLGSGAPGRFSLSPDALWLLGFGLPRRHRLRGGWHARAAVRSAGFSVPP